MTAAEIIEEIKRLTSAELIEVAEFARQMAEGRLLRPEKLGELAKRMAETEDPAEADRLQEEIVRGFYGGEPHSQHVTPALQSCYGTGNRPARICPNRLFARGNRRTEYIRFTACIRPASLTPDFYAIDLPPAICNKANCGVERVESLGLP